jgi:hypothetical protein
VPRAVLLWLPFCRILQEGQAQKGKASPSVSTESSFS